MWNLWSVWNWLWSYVFSKSKFSFWFYFFFHRKSIRTLRKNTKTNFYVFKFSILNHFVPCTKIIRSIYCEPENSVKISYYISKYASINKKLKWILIDILTLYNIAVLILSNIFIYVNPDFISPLWNPWTNSFSKSSEIIYIFQRFLFFILKDCTCMKHTP